VTKKSHRPPPPPRPRWTIQRATTLGIGFGLAALLIEAFFGEERRWLFLAYVALLGLTALAGASVLWITAFDMRRRGTSHLMRPVRGFDVSIGVVLLGLAAYGLRLAWPAL
jgi:hypothetical protein